MDEGQGGASPRPLGFVSSHTGPRWLRCCCGHDRLPRWPGRNSAPGYDARRYDSARDRDTDRAFFIHGPCSSCWGTGHTHPTSAFELVRPQPQLLTRGVSPASQLRCKEKVGPGGRRRSLSHPGLLLRPGQTTAPSHRGDEWTPSEMCALLSFCETCSVRTHSCPGSRRHRPCHGGCLKDLHIDDWVYFNMCLSIRCGPQTLYWGLGLTLETPVIPLLV